MNNRARVTNARQHLYKTSRSTKPKQKTKNAEKKERI